VNGKINLDIFESQAEETVEILKSEEGASAEFLLR
jgi:hypothetical protein